MTKKDAVIFAAYMPRIERAHIYIDALKYYYPECDIYIGLNTSVPEFETLLINNGLMNITKVDPNIEVNSDASSFQAALKTLKNTNKNYEKIHFLHTKGVSYPSDAQWKSSYESYFLGYCKRKFEVENGFNSNSEIGGVSYVGRKEPMNNSGYSIALEKYYKFPRPIVENMMSLITFYSIKGSIVKNFINNCDDTFFTDKLDRYFFETSFPLIVDRSGYTRHHLVIW
jgi:hypothetical protein